MSRFRAPNVRQTLRITLDTLHLQNTLQGSDVDGSITFQQIFKKTVRVQTECAACYTKATNLKKNIGVFIFAHRVLVGDPDGKRQLANKQKGLTSGLDKDQQRAQSGCIIGCELTG